MPRDLITLTDETGAAVQFEWLDVVEHGGADYAVLLPADEDAEMFMILRAEQDPADANDCIFYGIEEQDTIDAVFARFQKRHPELF